VKIRADEHVSPEVDRFIEAARALECDEDKERFEAKLKRIARAKPVPPKDKE
jgi:hypothetical protein